MPKRLLATFATSKLVGIALEQPIFSTVGFVYLAKEKLNPIAFELIEYICKELTKPV
ncbi:hypothetical protein KPC83_05935 [Collinsella sp. zg1085]|uniref:hypothetical protein n=1 Tax=Collinsella sp. zg1085 TaxID=2844380 RepID=UPI001C0BA5FC|nr:hypothetical protein [Collinsella sp. zg1085]QWT17377.1 hypothetical protein KPC83_05935 [Collinsella sp. zg1085]